MKEKNRRKSKAWRLANPERHRANMFAWLAKNAERRRAQTLAWQAANPQRAEEIRRGAERRRRARKLGAEGSHTEAEWLAVVELYGGRCAYCAKKPKRLTRDHVIPLSRGGTDHIDNVVPACSKCNIRKRAMTLEEYMPLIGMLPLLPRVKRAS